MLLIACAVVLLLVVLNGVFAMSELAVVSSRKAKLQSRAERGDTGAAAALKLSEDPTRFLSAVQVGITLIGILAGAYGQATIAGELTKSISKISSIAFLHDYAAGISTGIVVVLLTYFSLILGELAPKRFAMIYPETIAAVVAKPLSWMAMAMHPFVSLLTISTAGLLRLIGVKDEKGEAITQEEVETVLAEGANAGLIEPEEQLIIGEVMRLGDRPIRVAMTPRKDVYWVSLADDEQTQRNEIRACPYSRIVVAEGMDIDEPKGIVHKKSVLDKVLDGGPLDLASLVATPLYIPETTSVLKALELFKQTPHHMALVVNEFGALEGVVTAIDILEMIAGDFPESHDEGTSHAILQREDGSFLVDGRADLDDLNKELGLNVDEDGGFHTAAGLVLQRLGHLPAEGETLTYGGYRIEIIDMDERRIDKLLFKKLPPKPAKPKSE
jgi:putative hemolysin